MKAFCVSARPLRLTCIHLSCFVLLLQASTVSKAADDPKPKDLRQFYQQNCARCHGADGAALDTAGKSLRGQDFTDPRWQESASDDKMAKVILKGKLFGLAMPGFKAVLTSEEALRMATEIIRKCQKGKTIEPVAKAAGLAR